MAYLLDTHVLVWHLAGVDRLGPSVSALLRDPDADLRVSIASIWEIAAKASRVSLGLPSPVVPWLHQHLSNVVTLCPIAWQHIELIETLPRHHGDPFDCMLIAQALVDGLTLVTADRQIQQYPVPVLDAGS